MILRCRTYTIQNRHCCVFVTGPDLETTVKFLTTAAVIGGRKLHCNFGTVCTLSGLESYELRCRCKNIHDTKNDIAAYLLTGPGPETTAKFLTTATVTEGRK